MRLHHVDLPVADVAAVRAFFETHFGLRCVFATTGGPTVLADDADFALTLSPRGHGDGSGWPAGFHIGFNLASEPALRAACERLAAAGVAIVRPIGDLGGAPAFQCLAPDGIVVELACRPA